VPSEATKLLERARHSKVGWKRNEIDRLYKGYGFVIKPGANHDKVYHPDFPQLITSLPRHNRVHEYIVGQAIKLIDRLNQLQSEKEGSDE
jgi:hypothetical protein